MIFVGLLKISISLGMWSWEMFDHGLNDMIVNGVAV